MLSGVFVAARLVADLVDRVTEVDDEDLVTAVTSSMEDDREEDCLDRLELLPAVCVPEVDGRGRLPACKGGSLSFSLVTTSKRWLLAV